ncbi:efflux RND transporter periplasmic adaptor subunit [Pelagicoccus sp. SDUM812002]|uniref:efflux RND transporter periplasmic adaptor subunit n=1 Tax=Pelagicoccus sp. SDUM812002 TaxID=3041266 RepID=UPI0028100608|nr:efflux RND transporter periplasmic adaptor subunit [Pelagicoccus sp. SDUM812002]MDQ8185668.1 efflux RND transporter periplasmic adaptor subunit [Pelagicoccus sp. SDUM812002]
MIKAFLTILGLLGLIFAAIFLVKAKQFEAAPPMAFPPAVITTAIASEQTWEQTVRATGSFRASKGVMVSAEVAGSVAEIHFESGQEVNAGDLLLTLDDSTEQAQLRSAEASASLANVNLKRSSELLNSRTISQSELDQSEATASQANAQLEQIKAVLDKKRIHAPFSGTLGIRLVDIGEYLSPGIAIASLQQLDPIYIDFNLPQKQLQSAAKDYPVEVSIDSYPDTTFRGTVEATNPELDTVTRTFRVRAILPNPDHKLRPGMFGSVEVVQPEPLEIVAIPATAIYYQAYGNSIFVIKASEDGSSKTVEQRFVKLGKSKGDYVSVIEGLEPGEEVATAGVFKLSNGRAVVVDNSKAIEPSLNPKPDNA